MPFGGESVEDNGLPRGNGRVGGQSPMPFGGESVEDIARKADIAAREAAVTNAFRRGVR